MDQKELKAYLNQLLNVDMIKDYCPNGLQVDGKKDIHTIVTGVSASLELIEAATLKKADAILVHHGYFWKGENQAITGIKYQRIKSLIKHDINLFAYHLPLDVHPTLGNNAQLAQLLGLNVSAEFDTGTTPNYGIICDHHITLAELTHLITDKLKRTPLIVGKMNENIQKIAICTGGAQDFIEHAYYAGADVYISGEISERTTLIARELGITYIAAGHHATERYGIKALGQHLAEHFDLTHHFIDIDNPV
ncbi:Nif3-like dinuclear metal center hexameric protein [Cysteiniphilum sp. QT6929]|uniref:Nif3-like dinuclear metal center hexameric protein n=1 Tax=Cysteiniphilum sp. QT6929 TaxID=2975055 RepID=UPI0024B3B46B|nr:Nif3-like dinuclear metal center hexameric protein [Cysteiniphilum sp. QT6929]WHN66727.1 Nif3-like dinuclear metal center hexameric protein [Cysteiniphilum sp. QT6929]